MILPFSTQLNGKPTHFVEKIWKSLKNIDFETYDKIEKLLSEEELTEPFEIDYSIYKNVDPKIHTIREDKKNRWKVGTKIHFFINCRQKDMFRFAPVLPVVSKQKIELIWKENTENHTFLGTKFDRICTIKIDDRFYGDAYLFNGSVVSSSYTIPTFANNDGFDTPDELFAYFNKNFKGKIIHWTDFKY